MSESTPEISRGLTHYSGQKHVTYVYGQFGLLKRVFDVIRHVKATSCEGANNAHLLGRFFFQMILRILNDHISIIGKFTFHSFQNIAYIF